MYWKERFWVPGNNGLNNPAFGIIGPDGIIYDNKTNNIKRVDYLTI